MKFLIFNKIILSIIIAGLVFGSLGNIFIPKAEAQTGYGPATPGAAVGQALAAGAACFLATKLENFMAGLATKPEGTVEGKSDLLLFPEAVPSVALNLPVYFARIQTSDALMKSKDCIRDVVVKMIIDWLVDETVEWIQNGGQPRYVTNWDSFLSDAFNVGVGEIINQTNLAWLCKPFGLQVRIALLPVQRFQNRITCTLDDIVANIEDFYEDFRNGGWLAYEEQWYPQNNFYGATLMAISEAQSEGARQQAAAEKEAMAGKGFLSVKQCTRGAPLLNDTEEDRQIMKEMGYVKDQKGNYCLPKDMEIITPGDIVGAATAKAVTSDIEWTANVKSWTAALVNATINRLFKEGLGLMKKSTAPRRSDYGGDYDPYRGYNPVLSLAEKERNRILDQYIDFLDYFNAILANKKQSLSSEEQILVILNELKQRNCQPPVSDSDITAALNEIARLTNDVAYYQTAVDELNANITAAQNIKNFTDREIALLTQKYQDFVYKYQDFIQEILPGPETTKKLSQEESQTKQNKLSSTQSRLTICIATTP